VLCVQGTHLVAHALGTHDLQDGGDGVVRANHAEDCEGEVPEGHGVLEVEGFAGGHEVLDAKHEGDVNKCRDEGDFAMDPHPFCPAHPVHVP